MFKRLFLTGLFLIGGSAANAAVVVQFTGATGNQWHYDVSLSPGVFLQKDNFFTVYDFKGLQSIQWDPVVLTPADWSETLSPGTSGVPGQINPAIDDPNLPNATITFLSNTPFDPGATIVPLGSLTLTGLAPGPLDPTLCGALCTNIPFASQTWQKGQTPTLFGNLALVAGPSTVPEPSTVGLMVAGLLAVGAIARRRRVGSN